MKNSNFSLFSFNKSSLKSNLDQVLPLSAAPHPPRDVQNCVENLSRYVACLLQAVVKLQFWLGFELVKPRIFFKNYNFVLYRVWSRDLSHAKARLYHWATQEIHINHQLLKDILKFFKNSLCWLQKEALAPPDGELVLYKKLLRLICLVFDYI